MSKSKDKDRVQYAFDQTHKDTRAEVFERLKEISGDDTDIERAINGRITVSGFSEVMEYDKAHVRRILKVFEHQGLVEYDSSLVHREGAGMSTTKTVALIDQEDQ